VKEKDDITNLHALWDWAFGAAPDTMPPVPQNYKDDIKRISGELMG